MASFGQGVNPSLGLINYAPYLQGAQQGAASMQRGMENLGAGLARGIEMYAEQKKKNQELEGSIKGSEKFLKSIQDLEGIPESIKANALDAMGKLADPKLSTIQRAAISQNVVSGLKNLMEMGQYGMQVKAQEAQKAQQDADGKAINVGLSALGLGRDPFQAVQSVGLPLSPGAAKFLGEQMLQRSQINKNNAEAAPKAAPDPSVVGSPEWQRVQNTDTAKANLALSQDAAKRKENAENYARQSALEQAQKRQASTIGSIDQTLATIQEAFELSQQGAGGPLQGKASVADQLNMFGAGKHKSFINLAETIKASLSLGNLMKMREESKTGGALGNVSDKDIELLGSDVAKLDPTLSEPEFRKRLMKVNSSLVRIRQGAAAPVALPEGWTIIPD